MPELLSSTPEKRPPSGGALFSEEEIAALQDNLNRGNAENYAQTQAEIQGLIDNGVLGKRVSDLGEASVAPAPSPEVPVDRFHMSDAEIADIASGPRIALETAQEHAVSGGLPATSAEDPYKRPRRRVHQENSDGTAWTDAQWEAANAADRAERAARGEKTLAEQREEYLANKAERDGADNTLLESMNPRLLEESLKKYGREGTLAILKGDSEVPRYTGPESNEPTFTHASTGESMTKRNVNERLSDVESSRIGQAVGGLARAARGQRTPFKTELHNTPNGLVSTETGKLDEELDMEITTKADGGLVSVELIVHSAGEEHAVGVMAPESDHPIVLIDDEPADQSDAATAEAVIEEAQAAIEQAALAESAHQEPQGQPVDKEPVAAATPEAAEVNLVEEKNVEETGEISGSPEATLSQQNTPTGEAQPLTPEQRERLQKMEAVRFFRPLFDANPREFMRVFQEIGIENLSTIRPENIQLTRDVGQYVGLIQEQGYESFMKSLNQNHHPSSQMGKIEMQNRAIMAGFMRALFKASPPK